jgi:glutamyl-tRNA synthetase
MSTAASSLSPADRETLAALLFPGVPDDLGAIAARYPPRDLPEGAMVTRFAPSPTGFIHIGSLMASLLNWKLAQQTGGVFILRIEDTDRRREVEGGTAMIVAALTDAGLVPHEGPIPSKGQDHTGAYGPYLQSERQAIYHGYARDFVRRGLAYPCFLGEDELREIRNEQQAKKVAIGVYGEWARFRDAPVAEVEQRLSRSEKFVLRLRSAATEGQRLEFRDRIRGVLDLPANPLDTVLVKSDGFPTYHFAHPIDDTLMGVNLVIRGDEWISTTPIHLQIFEGMGVTPPPIAHIAPVAKLDGESRRKLSKRLDPEASMDFYHEAGYPAASIIEYLLNLLDSSFEIWRGEHPALPFEQFELSIDNLGRSSSLFDLAKLSNVSRDVIARFSGAELVAAVQQWANVHAPRLAEVLRIDPAHTHAALNIGRDDDPPRKDISMWSDVRTRHAFFFSECFAELVPGCYAEMPELERAEIRRVLQYFADDLDASLEAPAEEWFPRVKAYALEHGYAKNPGALKKSPDAFKGLVGDFVMVLRVAVTGSRRSPDLPAVMRILGAPEVRARLEAAMTWAREV